MKSESKAFTKIIKKDYIIGLTKLKHTLCTCFYEWSFSRKDYCSIFIISNILYLNLGHLSTRMQIPGNIWSEAWQSAKPVPARRQKRLFDDTKEAEKVRNLGSTVMLNKKTRQDVQNNKSKSLMK